MFIFIIFSLEKEASFNKSFAKASFSKQKVLYVLTVS